MNELKMQVAPLLARIDALSRRERLLVMITMLTVIAGVWQQFVIEPLGHRADARRIELQSLRERTNKANENLQNQILQLASAGSDERVKAALIQQRIDEINRKIGNYAAELIDPSEMALVLEEVLREQTSLSLIKIRNTTPERLATDEEGVGTSFYRHGLEIELVGSYADCLRYLTEIEALPWRLYWQVLDIETLNYPTNRVRLEVSTLSLDEEWIGA
jgi:MSHA biogenesis protein MshJ